MPERVVDTKKKKTSSTGYIAEFTCCSDQASNYKFTVVITPKLNDTNNAVWYMLPDIFTTPLNIGSEQRATQMTMIASIKDAYLHSKRVILKGVEFYTSPKDQNKWELHWRMLESVTLKDITKDYEGDPNKFKILKRISW